MDLSSLLSSQTKHHAPHQPFQDVAQFAMQSQGSIPTINQPHLPSVPGMMQQQQSMQIMTPQVNLGAASSGIVTSRGDRQSKLEGPLAKKPKYMFFEDGGSDDEDGKPRTGNKQSTEAKRSQHCEVEKRRRERMNRYMAELAQMIPACNAVPRRLDKLSILKMAVDHMKNLRGDPHASSDYKPGFLTDEELKQLVVEAANGFMLIIQCTQAKILFVSDTVSEVLSEEPDSWIGSCLYDLLHPKDIQKVKEQLSCLDIDEAKKASSVKQSGSVANSPPILHDQPMNGLRRSFLCRIKKLNSQKSMTSASEIDCSNSESVIKLLQSTEERIPYQYAVLHCTGFIRNLTIAEKEALHVDETSMGACLVAVARLQHFGDNVQKPKINASENEFVTRIGVDGRFTYVDPRVAGVLGYLPQDLIGQICYEYYHPEDIQKMVHLHHDAMKCRTPMPTVQYRILTKNQKWLWLAMKAFSFTNPFSQQVEYVVCTNVTMLSSEIDCPGEVPTTTNTTGEKVEPVINNSLPSSGLGGTPNDVDKQERIERYVRMTIQNQAESMLACNNSENTHELPSGALDSDTTTFNDSSLKVLSIPATTTIEENAATVQRILEDYNKMHVIPLHRKDMNYQFPEGLFNSEVDLEGSQEAYRNILTEFDNPADFTSLFNQIEVDPMHLNNIFQDVSMDIFD